MLAYKPQKMNHLNWAGVGPKRKTGNFWRRMKIAKRHCGWTPNCAIDGSGGGGGSTNQKRRSFTLRTKYTLTEIEEGKDHAGRHDAEDQIDKICRRRPERLCKCLVALAVTIQGCFPAGMWHAVRITVFVDQY